MLTPIYGATGILRYPTKPLRLASETPIVSILTFYMHVLRKYTTNKFEVLQDKNLMGILKARTMKACPYPREYGPVNWYKAPLDAQGLPVCYDWSLTSLRKYVTECLQVLGGHTNHFPVHRKSCKILARAHRPHQGQTIQLS